MASMAFMPSMGSLAALVARDGNQPDSHSNSNSENPLLALFKDPFASTLASASLYSAIGISIGFTLFLAICFSLLRPYNQAVYAPKVKHADEKHAPPAIGKSLFAWVHPVLHTNEDVLMHTVGMDATIFIRFMRMCRNMFLVLSLIGVGILVPVHLTKAAVRDKSEFGWLVNISPLNVFGRPLWAQVVTAYLFDAIVAGFLWWNYRKIAQLRRRYFETEDFQTSLASRTLMLYDMPRECASDEGIARIIDEVAPSSSFARTAIARNVKELPELIEQHDHTVRKLEEVLAKYLKNPQKLPPKRPTCKPSKKDYAYSTYPSGQKLDAIDYYTKRIRDLEAEIKQVRASVDKRSTMPYGFASYSDIAEAHSIAYSFRKKKPQGTTVTLAPRPNDVIWRNMPLTAAVRSRRRWANNFWIAVLTLLWIGPNALIAMLFVNLSNLGRLWPAFETSLKANPKFWGLVQGILAPTLTSLAYLVLPMIFRRLSTKGGDQTKTGRERHVIGKMYAFFVFNNLVVFSFFSTVFTFVLNIIRNANSGESGWDAIKEANKNNNGQSIIDGLFQALCSNGVFWVTYLLQRQLGAATDLAQLWSLTRAFFLKKFSSPTPRELIELTAPPPFEYASYYTYFLFYATSSLCFAGIMPLVLPAAALYFSLDHYLKKYLILYRFITKTESGGLYWRVVFNRFIFGTMLANLVVLLTTWVRGDGDHIQFFAVIPLPFLMLGFKFWCANTFDNKIRFYSLINVRKNPEAARAQAERLRSEKLASRFGHPALYKKLITPMVHQRAQNLLPSVYSGRLTDGREAEAGDLMSVSGYSDMYALDSMKAGKTAKAAGVPGFEFVSENHMDFEYFKDRAEFLDEHGGADFYGIESDRGTTRAGTPVSFDERPGSAMSGRTAPFGPPRRVGTGMSDTSYSSYRPQNAMMDGHHSRQASGNELDRMRSPLGNFDNSSSTGLVHAQPVTGYSEVPVDGRSSPGPQAYSRYQDGPDSGRASPVLRSIVGPRGYQPLDGGRATPAPRGYQDMPLHEGRMSPAPRSRSQSPGPAAGPFAAALRQTTQSPGPRQMSPAPRQMSPAPRQMSPAPRHTQSPAFGRSQSPGPAAALHQPQQQRQGQSGYRDDFQGGPGQPGFYGGPSR
ncbi:DUF221 domain-containing protein [Cordyceps javanica]|uniref:DUF221 domain-containing protein n=1 Tax=Cordyceps javanica TaxID=43265 RepID=A0A545UW98_9HYPO|nr:DUF221 domain-containing protein [Cordyceps javanica]TQW04517.1 DUF221 domain protein [Cordyceps javanica]